MRAAVNNGEIKDIKVQEEVGEFRARDCCMICAACILYVIFIALPIVSSVLLVRVRLYYLFSL